MTRTDEVGAVAAATYFMDLFRYVLRTGDHVEWDRIGIEDCNFCTGTRARVERVYGSGGRIEGGDMTLGDAEVLGFDDALGVYAVSVPSVFASGTERDSAGNVLATYEAVDGMLVVEVIYSTAGWTLVGAYERNAELNP